MSDHRCKGCAGERKDKYGRCFYCGAGEKRTYLAPGSCIPIGSLNVYGTQQQSLGYQNQWMQQQANDQYMQNQQYMMRNAWYGKGIANGVI